MLPSVTASAMSVTVATSVPSARTTPESSVVACQVDGFGDYASSPEAECRQRCVANRRSLKRFFEQRLRILFVGFSFAFAPSGDFMTTVALSLSVHGMYLLGVIRKKALRRSTTSK
eukprot:6206007-Pleurochrysis_carterae.AAC.2